MIGDDALTVGPVSVSFLDAEALTSANYRIQLDLWPSGTLALTQLGRRFDTFVQELHRVRNQARVAGLLAHGIAMPKVYRGALLTRDGQRAAEFQVYDTHVTIVPVAGDPWQIPLGAVTAVRLQGEPPGVVLETAEGLTTFGQLGRQRDACADAIVERRETQHRLLAELTGHAGFSDGSGIVCRGIDGVEQLLERFTAPERHSCRRTVLASATGDARLGFVQLLDPDTDTLRSTALLPNNWAAFLLTPVGAVTVLEILAGPSAATYIFRADIDTVNRDLQLLHFRRAPLALTADQAELTPSNTYRLALRKLEPLQRLRSATVARVIHTESWYDAYRAGVS